MSCSLTAERGADTLYPLPASAPTLRMETSFHQHAAHEHTSRAPCAVGTGVPRSFLDTSPSTQPQQSDLSALSQVHPCITTLLLIKTVFRDAAVCFETVSEYQPRRGEMKAKAMQSHLSIVPKTL